jgi:hypothetical protein
VDELRELLAAGPKPQRFALRALLAVGRRPRGCALLGRIPPVEQMTASLLALERYDDPPVARELGWDAARVIERGRALRRAEGRP